MIFKQSHDDRKVRHFSLSADFLAGFDGLQPDWGPVGYFTYKRTYAMTLDEQTGQTEEFWQTCQRVVEGVYNIQKIHCRRLGLPWSEPKAQRSAQEMFRRMWNFKFTPPGRGLAQMGRDFMYEKGGACLNNCFAPEVKAWVQQSGFQGPRLAGLGELAEFSQGERSITVLAGDGEMRRAVARSFGVQKLVKVSFAPKGIRSNYRMEFDVTPNHRWLLSDGTETTEIKVGDVVKVTPSRYFGSGDSTDEVEGFAHGLVFGDGARHTYYADRHQIRLCGEKEQVHVSRLEESAYQFNTTYPESYNGDAMVWFKLNDGMDWKALPRENSSASYQRAFLQGWLAADASQKPAGTLCLNTQNPEAAQWLVERAPLLGFCVIGFNYDPVMETNYGPRSAPMARITVTIKDTEYIVKSIMDEGREEEVFCITEPETGTFTLEGGLVTGNCAFISSEHIDDDFADPFTFLMDMSMLGVGVGGDTRGGGKVRLVKPRMDETPYVVPDSREGWVAMAKACLNPFVGKGAFPSLIDFSEVRKAGEPIKGFGGTASGPGPLAKLAKSIAKTLAPKGVEVSFDETLNEETGEILRLFTVFDGEGESRKITSGDITDIFNMVGACVVAGGVRRSAEIMFGQADDLEFRTLKDPTGLNALYAEQAALREQIETATLAAKASLGVRIDSLQGEIEAHPLRTHRWASNNSIFGTVGMDYTEVGESIAKNGEPGILWLKNAQDYGRMIDAPDFKDRRAKGANPCSEQTLESYELCCLVETYPAHHDSYEDYERTLKFAYLYAKTVTLVPTHNPRTNAVMNRNRRIGCSMSGIRQAIEKFGRRSFLQWADHGYRYIQELDEVYADWLGIPRSIKTTSVKPSGTVSLLCGATPGIHPPHSPFYIRNIRVHAESPLLKAARDAGYKVEPDAYADRTFVISFPVKTEDCRQGKRDVSIWDQVALASDIQRYWADNQVSVTVTFTPEEASEIPKVLEVFEDRLKSISFLPLGDDHGYVQAPYIEISEDEYNEMVASIRPMDMSTSIHEQDDMFCDGEACMIDFGS